MDTKDNGLPGTANPAKSSSLSREGIGLLLLITLAIVFYLGVTYVDIAPAIFPSSYLDQDDASPLVSKNSDRNFEPNTEEVSKTSAPEISTSVSEGSTSTTTAASAVTTTGSNVKTTNASNYIVVNTNVTETVEPELPANITISKSQNVSEVMTSELLRNPEMVGQCERLPFLLCDQTKVNASGTKQFHVALLRRPRWLAAFSFTRCEYSNCVYDDSRVSEKTDLVVVYVGGLNDGYSPPKRWPHQRYAAAVWESPPHANARFLYDSSSVWNHAFNLTATYRTDSDIFIPYGRLRFRPQPLKDRPDYTEIARSKNKTAAWFVSNCRTPSRRDEYVKEMQKYIDVDIYGACGQPCARDNPECLAQLPRKYKFYLSFENSICTDYVTEKLFKLFAPDMHVIPVVRGGANYDQHLPKNTVVNAANFKTAKDLALHLKALSGDLKAYSKMLEVKDMFRSDPGQGIDGSACIVCKFLNTKPLESKVYNMKEWMGDKHCKDPSDIT